MRRRADKAGLQTLSVCKYCLRRRMAKRMVILGAAESGVGAAILAGKEGFDVFVSDAGNILERYKNDLKQFNIAFEEGKHS